MSSKKDEAKAIDRTIEETKDSTRKVIQEVKRELPENTATFHDFQEQNINAVRDMTTTFLDSQKQVAKSLRSMFANNMFVNPQFWTENYVRAATTMADATVAAVRLSNDIMVESLASTRSIIDYAQKNTRELSRMSVEHARTMEQMTQEYSRSL